MFSTIRTTSPISLALALAAALTLAPPTEAHAQVEFEADPLAYALNGFSLHAAKVLGTTRLSVGTFGIDVPRSYHGNEGWSHSMRGAGVKWDYLGASIDGWFTGADAGFMRTRYSIDPEGTKEQRNVIGAGVRAGYRLPLGGAGFYLSPWVSVSYNFDGDDVVVGTERFDRSAVTVFPTVHLGWRF
jgi:hypothetical protein